MRRRRKTRDKCDPIDPTDVVINATGAAGNDGLADDLFRFARIGSRAGQ